jgi:flagellar basal-body rod protein FlgF
MDRLIWTAVSGMNASMARQRVIASNMANTQTPGFRAEVMAHSPLTLDGKSIEVRAFNSSEVMGAQMDQGTMHHTGRALDIAVNGDGLFAVQATDGSEAYTRRGDLSLSPSGLLVNGDGVPLLGQDGPISVPPGSDVTINPDGAVLALNKADPSAPAVQLDRIKVVSWRGNQITKGIDGLFRANAGGVLPPDPEAKLLPETLEQSNVKPSQVLVEMVEAQRLFDMRTKLVATAKELDEGGASLMRL